LQPQLNLPKKIRADGKMIEAKIAVVLVMPVIIPIKSGVNKRYRIIKLKWERRLLISRRRVILYHIAKILHSFAPRPLRRRRVRLHNVAQVSNAH